MVWYVVSILVVCLLLRFIVLMLKLTNVKRWRFVRYTGRISADAAGGLIGRKCGPKKEKLKYSSVAKYFKAVAKYFKF